MISRHFTILVFLLWGHLLKAQDFSWWNTIHDWDGHTPWSDYMIISPAFMGPNALPVPEVRQGKMPVERSFELALDGHYSKGDQTGNLYTELFFPLFSDRAGLEIRYVPVEIYKTDTVTRDIRRSREYDARGVSYGDVYFSTYIHLVKEKERIPDVMLSVNLKTASGTRYEAARHTDAPGYSFDISAGKDIYSGDGRLRNIRCYATIGFFVYQTNLENYMQNDAVQYGAGSDFTFGKFGMEHEISGYAGYLDNGDRPMVYRMNLSLKCCPALELGLRFQQGFFDFPYSSARLLSRVRF